MSAAPHFWARRASHAVASSKVKRPHGAQTAGGGEGACRCVYAACYLSCPQRTLPSFSASSFPVPESGVISCKDTGAVWLPIPIPPLRSRPSPRPHPAAYSFHWHAPRH